MTVHTKPRGGRSICAIGILAEVCVALVCLTTRGEPLSSLSWIDSETGYAIASDRVNVITYQTAPPEASAVPASSSPRAASSLPPGVHSLSVTSPEYRPWSGEVIVGQTGPPLIRIRLDPLKPPRELQADSVRSLHRPDATVVVGFVVEDESAQPVAGVRVFSPSSGAEAQTDGRGFFLIYLPVPALANAEEQAASLVFEKPTYGTVEYEHVEVWPNGDWTFRVRLPSQGALGRTTFDQRPACRRPSDSDSTSVLPDSIPPGPNAASRSTAPLTARDSSPNSSATGAGGVRMPRNIRVLDPNGTIVDYMSLDSYCRHVLPQEWIASWAAYTGGSNSLNAGAVTIRSYAVGYINQPKTGTYDICGTTSCQVYGPATSTYSDTAVDATAQLLLVDAYGAIPAALTEYSAENNSLGSSCTDGFTAPASGCLYDPVCAGESRNGHGRGLCQWGSAKWATGLKFPANSTRDHATLNGFPRRDWVWILQHYYPTLRLTQAAPLAIGDSVRALTAVRVRVCAGGSISDGLSCPALATQAAGSVGRVLAGPLQVTSDGAGYTWYQVQWPGLTGWSVENYLDRVLLLPNSPADLIAHGTDTTSISISWLSEGGSDGFEIERAPGAPGPWSRIAVVSASETTFVDNGLYSGSTWFYRVRAFNAGGVTEYSNVSSATTIGLAPLLAQIPDQFVNPGGSLKVSSRATAADSVELITDFENYVSDSANGGVLFREPRFSETTSGFLADSPNLAVVTDVFPPQPASGERVLRVSCSFDSPDSAWLRLTTDGAPSFSNAVIDFTKKLQFDLYSDKAIGVGLGVRETDTPLGTPVGSDGGSVGPIEWVGVTNVVAGQPTVVRRAAAGAWTTFTFDFGTEPIHSFSGGNGVLSTASGLGALDHLALVPFAGAGLYNIYLDNFVVLTPKTLTYALAPGAPSGMNMDPTTGVLTWTPTAQQSSSTTFVTVRVSDNGSPSLSAVQSFRVTTGSELALLATVSGNQLSLSWNAAVGLSYRLQFKSRLQDSAWTDLEPLVTATTSRAARILPLDGSQGFYRVRVE